MAAVVLAGGRSRRLGGVDKPSLTVAGRSLLDGVLAACVGAEPIVVVGPRRSTRQAVLWTREHPAHSGPVAALAAGLQVIPPNVPLCAVLAADLPRMRADTLGRLRAALVDRADQRIDGAVLVDAQGRRQWLCGVWRTAALHAGLRAIADPANVPMHVLLGGLNCATLPAEADEALDVDTPEDLRAARQC